MKTRIKDTVKVRQLASRLTVVEELIEKLQEQGQMVAGGVATNIEVSFSVSKGREVKIDEEGNMIMPAPMHRGYPTNDLHLDQALSFAERTRVMREEVIAGHRANKDTTEVSINVTESEGYQIMGVLMEKLTTEYNDTYNEFKKLL